MQQTSSVPSPAPPVATSTTASSAPNPWGVSAPDAKDSSWGMPPPSSSTPSSSTGSVWASSTASSMQATTSVASSSPSPNLLGWSSGSSSIGAQSSTSTDSAPSSSGDLSSSMWKGLSSTLSADWGGSISSSSSSSVIANSISSISATASVTSSSAPGSKPEEASSDWGRGAVGAASSGWGTSHPDPPKPDSETGWGSPDPLVNTGTEGWNQPDSKSLPTSQAGWGARGQTTPSGGWGGGSGSQEKPAAAPSGWASENKPAESAAPQRSSWGSDSELQKAAASGWGASAAPDSRSSSSSSWGEPEKPAAAAPPSQQWGAANPPSQWSGSSSAQQQQQQQSCGGTHPRPIGTQSWAQAAGRGLPPKPEIPPVEVQRDPKQEYISEAISSHEGWGKTPVRQDTTWDMTESPKTPRKNLGGAGVMGGGAGGGSSSSNSSTSSGGADDNHWHQPNDGTAIWESAKSSSNWEQNPRGPASQAPGGVAGAGGGVSGNQWNQQQREEGPNQWNNPTPNDNNMWNGPPKGDAGGNAQWAARRNSESAGRGSWSEPSDSNPSHPSHSGPSGPWPGREPPNKQWNSNDKPSWAGPDSQAQWGGGSGGNHPEPNQGGMKAEWNSETNQWQRSSTSGPESNEWNAQKKPDDNMWDRNGTNVWGDGSKTETGTWNQPRGPGSRSSAGSWDDQRNIEPSGWGGKPGSGSDVDNGTAYWGDPQSRKMNWNPNQGGGGAGGPGGPGPGPMGGMNQPQGAMGGGPRHEGPGGGGQGGGGIGMWNQPNNANKGWSDAPPGKMDDWGNQQGKGQWGAAPPAPDNPMMWQGPKPKGAPGWSDAPDWSNPPKVPFGSGGVMMKQNMRSQLIQQLTDAGFKKEDAQNALINNQMDMNMAVADLLASSGRKPDDLDLKSRDDLPRGPVDMGPPRMPNFSGAPSGQVMGQQLLANQLGKGPVHAPLSNIGGPSVQQRLLQHQMAAAAPKPQPSSQAQPGGYSMQQQVIQQQIVQQLHCAVQAGLISPQLLNQQLTPTMLVMLQQLLQLQQVLQRLVTQQQLIQQNRAGSPNTYRQRLEQVAVTIAKIRQQIIQQQQQITQAQKNMTTASAVKPPTASAATSNPGLVVPQPSSASAQGQLPQQSTSTAVSSSSSQELLKELPSDMNNLQIKDTAPRTSRLVQWKLPSPDREGGEGSSVEELNRAPGSRPSPNPHSRVETTSLPFSDSTWSTNDGPASSSSWPGSSSEHDTKSITSNDSRDEDTDDSGDPKAGLDIEEFVPGKQWKGTTSKTAEDDPFLTPGDLNRSLSVSTVKEDYIANTLGHKTGSSPTPLDGGGQWSSVGNLSSKQKWPSPNEPADLWGQSAKTRPPPGLAAGATAVGAKGPWPRQPAASQQGFHRSTSWAPGDGASSLNQQAVGGGGWGMSGAASKWILLKNLNPQVEGTMLKTLCSQNGTLNLKTFYIIQNMALISYGTKEEAARAQKSLNGFALGSTTLSAEFLSEMDFSRLVSQSTASSQAPSSSAASSSTLWPNSSSRGLKSEANSPGGWSNGTMWSSGSGSGSGSSLWAPALDEAPQNSLLPGDLAAQLGGH